MMGWDAAQMQPTAVSAGTSGAFSRGASSKGRALLQKRFGQLFLIVSGQPACRRRFHLLLVPLDLDQVMPAFQGPLGPLALNRCGQRSTLQAVEAASCRFLVSITRLEAASTTVSNRDDGGRRRIASFRPRLFRQFADRYLALRPNPPACRVQVDWKPPDGCTGPLPAGRRSTP